MRVAPTTTQTPHRLTPPRRPFAASNPEHFRSPQTVRPFPCANQRPGGKRPHRSQCDPPRMLPQCRRVFSRSRQDLPQPPWPLVTVPPNLIETVCGHSPPDPSLRLIGTSAKEKIRTIKRNCAQTQITRAPGALPTRYLSKVGNSRSQRYHRTFCVH